MRCANDTVPQYFRCGEVCHSCGEFARVGNEVAPGCDADTVGIGFLWSIIDNDVRIRDGAVLRDVLNLLEGQDMDGVCAGCVCFGVALR